MPNNRDESAAAHLINILGRTRDQLQMLAVQVQQRPYVEDVVCRVEIESGDPIPLASAFLDIVTRSGIGIFLAAELQPQDGSWLLARRHSHNDKQGGFEVTPERRELFETLDQVDVGIQAAVDDIATTMDEPATRSLTG